MQVFALLAFLIAVVEGAKVSPLCPQIKLKFGRVRYRQRGKVARFLCNTGFMLAGDRYSLCVQGQWDNEPPKCVRATCQQVKPPVNGLIYPSHSGAVLNFFCKSNFELRGYNITYCDGDNWNNPLPACLPSQTPPPLSCDFEREDLCGWNHDPNHDFDWKRLNFATPSGSIGTGPSHDHTKGVAKDGYYMYIESSARNVDDKARLISPVYDKSSENVCFQFYYHMYGSTTGDLRVYLKKTQDSWNLNPGNAVFSKSGNQGNRWYRGIVELGVIEDDFQIIIEGVRGTSYVSDIAIDDVKVILDCQDWDISTTEDPFLSTEPPIAVESCENRCGTNDTHYSVYLITCDCDDSCLDNDRCCPDYIDYCLFSTTQDEFTSSSNTWEENTVMTTPTTPSTRKTATPTTRKVLTTPTTPSTRKIATPTARKVVLTTPPIPTTTVKVTTGRKESKIIYVTPPSDLATLIPVTQQDDKESEVIEVGDGDKSDTQKIIVAHEMVESNTKTIVFAVGVVFGALFSVAGMAFVAKRYRLFRCLSLRRLNQSSNGDSQSDVRFLTGEEVLNLNLPDDYNTL